MSKLTRRETLAGGGKVIAAAAVLVTLPSIADAKEDAEILRAEAEVMRLMGEINAGLHSPDGNVSEEAQKRESALENAVADTPAKSLDGVAAKLRLAAHWIEEENKDQVEDRCTLSALEAVERLAGVI